jgi:hypothetical protein
MGYKMNGFSGFGNSPLKQNGDKKQLDIRNTKSIQKHVNTLSDQEMQTLLNRQFKAVPRNTFQVIEHADTIQAIKNRLISDAEKEGI